MLIMRFGEVDARRADPHLPRVVDVICGMSRDTTSAVRETPHRSEYATRDVRGKSSAYPVYHVRIGIECDVGRLDRIAVRVHVGMVVVLNCVGNSALSDRVFSLGRTI